MFDDFDTQINVEELYLWDDDIEDWELWVIDNELEDDWN